MPDNPPPTPMHWAYFLILEDDVISLSRYIEFSRKNFVAYSVELARLLLSATSEVDVVAKLICKELSAQSKAERIDHYRDEILPAFGHLTSLQVHIPRYGLSFIPWQNWAVGTSPDWWIANNKVKHQRDANYHLANLENVLGALSGLFALLLCHYEEPASLGKLAPNPRYLLPGTPYEIDTLFWDNDRTYVYKLP